MIHTPLLNWLLAEIKRWQGVNGTLFYEEEGVLLDIRKGHVWVTKVWEPAISFRVDKSGKRPKNLIPPVFKQRGSCFLPGWDLYREQLINTIPEEYRTIITHSHVAAWDTICFLDRFREEGVSIYNQCLPLFQLSVGWFNRLRKAKTTLKTESISMRLYEDPCLKQLSRLGFRLPEVMFGVVKKLKGTVSKPEILSMMLAIESDQKAMFILHRLGQVTPAILKLFHKTSWWHWLQEHLIFELAERDPKKDDLSGIIDSIQSHVVAGYITESRISNLTTYQMLVELAEETGQLFKNDGTTRFSSRELDLISPVEPYLSHDEMNMALKDMGSSTIFLTICGIENRDYAVFRYRCPDMVIILKRHRDHWVLQDMIGRNDIRFKVEGVPLIGSWLLYNKVRIPEEEERRQMNRVPF